MHQTNLIAFNDFSEKLNENENRAWIMVLIVVEKIICDKTFISIENLKK